MSTRIMRLACLLSAFLLFGGCDTHSNPADGTSISRNTHALQFLGTTGYVEISRPPELQPAKFSIELWVYFDSLYSDFMPLLSANVNERNTADGYSVKVESGKLYCRVATSSNIAAAYWASYTPPLKRWVHLACTFDGVQGRLFIDGSEVAHYPSAGDVWYGAANLWLGLGYHSDFGGYSPFRGMLDEVRIWDRALDAAQIARTMKATLPETEPGLIGYWNFDDPTFTDVAIDQSKYHNHGLIWGDAYLVTTTPF